MRLLPCPTVLPLLLATVLAGGCSPATTDDSPDAGADTEADAGTPSAPTTLAELQGLCSCLCDAACNTACNGGRRDAWCAGFGDMSEECEECGFAACGLTVGLSKVDCGRSCFTDTDCGGKDLGHVCLETHCGCRTVEDCGPGFDECRYETCFARCKSNDECRAANSGWPLCDSGTGDCVMCLTDADCVAPSSNCSDGVCI